MKKFFYFLALVLTISLLTACSSEPSKAPEPMNPVAEAPEPEKEPAPKMEPEPELKKATLYIGADGQFQKVTTQYEGDLSPDWLIDQIAQETGWDLTLSQPVITGKSGFSVGFSPDCALFTGPPDPQNEKYHVFDANSLAVMILDSIQKTLQQNFVYSELGDPDALDIYYFMSGDEPLVIPEADISLSLEEAYRKEPADLRIAMAFLGYEADGYESNLDETLNGEPYEAFAYEGDEHYLLWVPDGLILVYEYDAMTETIGELLYQTQPGARLHLTCNVSDIMSNVLVVSEVDGETATWMPSISLKDGSLNLGEIGYPYGQ